MDERRMAEHRFRVVKAAVFVVLLLLVPGIDALLRISDGSSARSSPTAGIDSQALLDVGDAFGSLQRIEAMATSDAMGVPEAYSEEIGFLPGARDVRVGESGTIVGYVVSEVPDDAQAALAERMESLGWTAVPLEGVKGATFVKRGGACTWALATCTQVEGGTSIVIRSVYS